MQAGGFNETQFQYSQPDDPGRAALMRWVAAPPSPVTITEVAPEPLKPSVAFCSLQPMGAVPLTMDGDQVPVNDGELVINLSEGDTLMCDWYRFPGGITAGDAGDEDSNDGVTFEPETGDASEALTGGTDLPSDLAVRSDRGAASGPERRPCRRLGCADK